MLSLLSQLDINSHSTFQVLRQLQQVIGFNLHGKNVLAIGSHDFLEHDGFVHYGAKDILAFECNPFVLPDLEERTKNHPNTQIFNACLWSEAGLEKELHFFKDNKYGASSLYPNQKLTDYVPECKELPEKVKLTTTTLDRLTFIHRLNLANCGWVSLDVQGSELEVLKGAKKLMEARPEVFYCEVSWAQLYKDAPLMDEVDQFFIQHNYEKLGVRVDLPDAQGDAIYIRK